MHKSKKFGANCKQGSHIGPGFTLQLRIRIDSRVPLNSFTSKATWSNEEIFLFMDCYQNKSVIWNPTVNIKIKTIIS